MRKEELKNVYWCFVCMCVCVIMTDPLELELRMPVSVRVLLGTEPGSPEERPVLSATKPALQPWKEELFFFKKE